jgi:hypothetical protein
MVCNHISWNALLDEMVLIVPQPLCNPHTCVMQPFCTLHSLEVTPASCSSLVYVPVCWSNHGFDKLPITHWPTAVQVPPTSSSTATAATEAAGARAGSGREAAGCFIGAGGTPTLGSALRSSREI